MKVEFALAVIAATAFASTTTTTNECIDNEGAELVEDCWD